MNCRQPTHLFWWILLVSQTTAFVHERQSCARIHHRRVDETPFRCDSQLKNTPIDVYFGQDDNNAEEIQDAYGRTIKRERNANDASPQADPLAGTTSSSSSSSSSSQPQINLEPLVVCGPSGVGKGTVIDSLRKRFYPDVFGFSVSHTTRKPRPGEIHGQHYYFTTVEEIQNEISEGLFVEHAEVHGNYYGTSKEAITALQRENKITILDIDVQGVKSVKTSNIPAKYIFIAPPSMAELEARLRGRGTETEEAISKRLGNAASEIEYGNTPGNFDRIFVNQNVETTVNEMVYFLTEWFPQLKTALLEPSELESELESEPEPNLSWDFLDESDKMMYFKAKRDPSELNNRAEVNGKYHGYYTVDLEEPEGPRAQPKLGNTNPNIALDRKSDDEEKRPRLEVRDKSDEPKLGKVSPNFALQRQVRDQGEHPFRELGPTKFYANPQSQSYPGPKLGKVNPNLAKASGKPSYPKLGKVNPNFAMELKCDDEEKAY